VAVAVVLAVAAVVAGVVWLGDRGNEPRRDGPVADVVPAFPKDAFLILTFNQDTLDQRGDKTYFRDLSGNGNDALCENVGFTPDGKVGGGLSGDLGGLALPKSLLNGVPNFTLTAWCKVKAPGFSLYRTCAPGDYGNPIFLACQSNENRFEVAAWNKDNGGDFWQRTATPPASLPDDWFFVAVSLADTGEQESALRIVINDKTYRRSQQRMAQVSNPLIDALGYGLCGGTIDEVAVFQRALSDAEITTIRKLGQNTPSLPASQPSAPAIRPSTDADIQRIAALPAAEQVEEVRKELTKRNPKFKGELESKIENDNVVELALNDPALIDVTPVQVLRNLRRLWCTAGRAGNFRDLGPLQGHPLRELYLIDNVKLTDLTPLQGMPLERLSLWCWSGSDVTPLKGMPLKSLNIGGSLNKCDLTPLAGSSLESLVLNYTQVSDLAPLKDLPLTHLSCNHTQVSDLAPLRGMRLKVLSIKETKVADLSPLKGLPLQELEMEGTLVTDLSPLKDLPLKRITGDFQASRDGEILRAIKTLMTINDKPVADFWKATDQP
jgi:hypothetical protein